MSLSAVMVCSIWASLISLIIIQVKIQLYLITFCLQLAINNDQQYATGPFCNTARDSTQQAVLAHSTSIPLMRLHKFTKLMSRPTVIMLTHSFCMTLQLMIMHHHTKFRLQKAKWFRRYLLNKVQTHPQVNTPPPPPPQLQDVLNLK